MIKFIREQRNTNCLLCTYASLLFSVVVLALGLWIGLSGNTTSAQLSNLQMEVTSLQMQIMELVISGDNSTTRTLRQTGTFQWAGLVSGVNECTPTTAGYSIYDIVVSNTLTFTQIILSPASLSLNTGNCPDDSNTIDIMLTNFQPLPAEIQYMSAPTTTVPMTPQTAAMYTSQCQCVIGPTALETYPLYQGIGLFAGQPSFTFRYTSTVGQILPLNFDISQNVTILLLI